jgi:glycosyltransferase involved in cell wall biosynthesis
MKISLEYYFSRISKNKDKRIKINISNFISTKIIDSAISKGINKNDHKEFDFMYPASGEPYKNHKKLIDDFIILAEDKFYPNLVLTLDEKKYKKLLTYIEDANNKYGLNIINVGIISFHKILELYAATNCLIYPSLHESSGLPLLEAKKMGISIVAGELDYVRDSVTPSNTFDPNSAISISRAVKRQLGIEDDLTEIMGADDFLLSLQRNLNL